jgi:hypothetical protein
MRARSTAATAAGAVALLLAFAGCGSSAPKQPPTATLTRAAYVSSAAPGYKMTMSLRETVPNAGQVTVTGNGGFNLVPRREGSMTMHLTLPAAATAGLGNLQMQAVFVPGTIYMKLPLQLSARLPGGKPWLLINLNQLGKAAGIPGLGQLANASSSLSNPGQYLQFLRATSGTVKNLGPATVNGVDTTHYRAVIDLAKLPNAVPASERAAVRQLVAALKSRGTTQLPMDSWIDSAHLIRRLAMNYSQPINGQQAHVALQVDFIGYGRQPSPTVPPASQTQNLLALTGGQP